MAAMVLMDATPLQSEHRVRGVGTYVRHLAEGLLEEAPDRMLFALTRKPALQWPALEERALTGWRLHRPAQMYWIHNEIFLREALARARASVFHATDFNGVVYGPRTKTIVTLHDLMAWAPHSSTAATLSERLSALRWQVYFRKLRKAHHIIAVSQTVQEEAVARLGIPAERITVIYPGVDVDRFSRGADSRPYVQFSPYVLFLGVPDTNKNVPRLLDAFAEVARKHPSATLVIGGAWPAAQVRWLETTCASLGIVARVKYLGYIPPKDLPALYRDARAFVFPSLAEGFGSPLVEAMASGTPVVTSNYGAPAEVVGQAALRINPLDTHEMARAISSLLDSSRLRERLAGQGRQRASAFSWKEVTAQTLAVYDHVVQDGHARLGTRLGEVQHGG